MHSTTGSGQIPQDAPESSVDDRNQQSPVMSPLGSAPSLEEGPATGPTAFSEVAVPTDKPLTPETQDEQVYIYDLPTYDESQYLKEPMEYPRSGFDPDLHSDPLFERIKNHKELPWSVEEPNEVEVNFPQKVTDPERPYIMKPDLARHFWSDMIVSGMPVDIYSDIEAVWGRRVVRRVGERLIQHGLLRIGIFKETQDSGDATYRVTLMRDKRLMPFVGLFGNSDDAALQALSLLSKERFNEPEKCSKYAEIMTSGLKGSDGNAKRRVPTFLRRLFTSEKPSSDRNHLSDRWRNVLHKLFNGEDWSSYELPEKMTTEQFNEFKVTCRAIVHEHPLWMTLPQYNLMFQVADGTEFNLECPVTLMRISDAKKVYKNFKADLTTYKDIEKKKLYPPGIKMPTKDQISTMKSNSRFEIAFTIMKHVRERAPRERYVSLAPS
jgi:hypothetical protein